MLKTLFRWIIKGNPSAEDMTTLLSETDELFEVLSKKIVATSLQSQVLESVKKIYDTAKPQLPAGTQGINKADWDTKSKNERGQLFADFSAIKRSLAGLDFPDIRAGARTFKVLVTALVLSVVSYIFLHLYLSPTGAPTVITPQSTDAEASVATVAQDSSNINTTSGTDNSSGTTNIHVPSNMPATGETEHQTTEAIAKHSQSIIAIETLITSLQLQLSSTPNDWNKATTIGTKLSDQISKDALSFRTIKLLGTLEGDLKQQDADAGKAALRALEASVTEDLEDPPAHYLWTTGAKKWIEIAFWAFFGVLVGLMYYVSTRLKQGLFDRQDISTMTTEALVAPVVACVIFFLFSKTGITEISPSGESVLVVLGVAFILGYAIRRTIGILDNLKKRILPEP